MSDWLKRIVKAMALQHFFFKDLDYKTGNVRILYTPTFAYSQIRSLQTPVEAPTRLGMVSVIPTKLLHATLCRDLILDLGHLRKVKTSTSSKYATKKWSKAKCQHWNACSACSLPSIAIKTMRSAISKLQISCFSINFLFYNNKNCPALLMIEFKGQLITCSPDSAPSP